MDHYTQPDLQSAVLITIDTQRDTLRGQPFEVKGTTEALPQMRRLLELFRRQARPIVHIVRLYLPDGSNAELCRRAAMEAGTTPFCPGMLGSELAEELLPDPAARLQPDLLLAGRVQRLGPEEAMIYKPRWGAFYQTPLEQHLRAAHVNTLVFIGCNYPNCPRSSIYEASERDYRIVLVRDAISNLDDRGVQEMRNIGVAVTSTRQLLEAMEVDAVAPRKAEAGEREF